MTEEEQDRIVGQIFSELASARKRLVCLETKAENLSNEFGLLANWLRGHFPSGVEMAGGISVEDGLALIEEIRETKSRIAQLEDRAAQLTA